MGHTQPPGPLDGPDDVMSTPWTVADEPPQRAPPSGIRDIVKDVVAARAEGSVHGSLI